ncbi:hypothetical protein IKG50_02410, partial [Candidatus Saccharibacteria bacterium]|nr:hypothetical protein [Candidatus Saccharibacteria bacterium]
MVGSDRTGYYESSGIFREIWASLNYENGPLGLPVGDILTNTQTGIVFQQYAGGFIVGNEKYGYHALYGKIGDIWTKQGWENGPLGLPVGDILTNTQTGIVFQQYAGGFIVGNEKYGYHA